MTSLIVSLARAGSIVEMRRRTRWKVTGYWLFIVGCLAVVVWRVVG